MVEKYGVTIFTDALDDGEVRTQVESYVRFAVDIDNLADDDFFQDYSELYDCIVPGDLNPNWTASQLVDLLKRHSREVIDVVERQLIKHNRSMVKVTLPSSCLLRLVATGRHMQNKRSDYVTLK